MKKVKVLLIMAVAVFSVMLCTSISAFALTEGDWEFKLLNNEAIITKYVGEGGDVVVPESIYGCPVTKLEPRIFQYHSGVTSIKIAAKVTEIPDSFAYAASGVTEVTIPEGITIIKGSAFQYCDNLKTVNLPSTLEHIESAGFESCKGLKNITLPEGLKTVGNSVFCASGIEEITIPASLESAGYHMFWQCHSLKKVIFNEGFKTVFGTMFRGCSSLTDVKLASTITKIDEGAFSECASLTELVLPAGLKVIGYIVFYGSPLKEIIIPYGVEEINTLTFDNKEIKSIYVPDTVTNIKGIIDSNRCPNAIVYCADGSKAAEFCQKHGISYLTDNSVNSGIHVFYNGKRISFHSYAQNPEILEGRTLVPLRSIFEAMGASVEWDGATSTATAKRGSVEVKITIGAKEILKNGEAIAVDVPAMLLNNRTMVPARVIAESFGADVEWNGSGRIVLINE